MRYLKIFILHFQHVLEQRLRAFIWLIVTFVNPLILILFWRGALSGNQEIAPGWTISTITSFYVIVAIAGNLLNSNIEEDISDLDVRNGELVRYLVKPVSYYWMKIFEEMPYHFLRGGYCLIIISILYFFFGKFITISRDPLTLIMTLVIAVLASFISNTFKIVIGLISLWIIDIWGIFEAINVIHTVLAGTLIPIILLPTGLKLIANILPFAYIIYYPVAALIGRLSHAELIQVIVVQSLWLIGLVILYKKVWTAGIKKFTAIGQ